VIYTRTLRVEFSHCDPIGIVFYPRYFEMINSVVENFFRDVVGRPFERMLADGTAVPAARFEVDFRAASRLGEALDWSIEVTKIGRSSATFAIEARGAGELRIQAAMTVVWTGRDGQPLPWPDEIRVHITPEAPP
jgi:4-hydroxybenzoyl-CoA thioesterase